LIAVLDFGSQYNLLITRRLRELGHASEMFRYDVSARELLARSVRALVLSGGPATVLDNEILPRRDVLDLGLPTLGICYGMQALCHLLGGRVERGQSGEYGRQVVELDRESVLLTGAQRPFEAWMSHFDQVVSLPPGVRTIARTDTCPHAAAEDPARKLFMVQFHPEVSHTSQGELVLRNFLRTVDGLEADWRLEDFPARAIEKMRAQVGKGRLLCAVSGGVDSTVAAVLAHRALGDQLAPIFVDHGLLRQDEAAQVDEILRGQLGLPLHSVDASERFLAALEGVEDPERKRKIIGETFIRVFEQEAQRVGPVDFLLQGTLYPDVIESTSVRGPSATIKSHHNVGGLPEHMKLGLVEPLRELFKDEVRLVGRMLAIPEVILGRHPFPGPGLAVRVLGPLTPERIARVRRADAIFLDELRRGGEYDKIWQAFAVLLPVKSVGVMGDERTYAETIALRGVTSVDGMTADWSRIPYEILERASLRIVNEVPGVNRVVYDVTSKPPGTIEWE